MPRIVNDYTSILTHLSVDSSSLFFPKTRVTHSQEFSEGREETGEMECGHALAFDLGQKI